MEKLDDKFTQPLPRLLYEDEDYEDIEYDDESYSAVDIDYTTQS
tara:strand:+ start:356 stop:487 length:132 start_codon:yes stop_codon:yes gene_type:complete